MPTDDDNAPAVPNSTSGAELPIAYRSGELLQGRRQVSIEHGAEMYRLRLTAAGRLYLTK